MERAPLSTAGLTGATEQRSPHACYRCPATQGSHVPPDERHPHSAPGSGCGAQHQQAGIVKHDGRGGGRSRGRSRAARSCLPPCRRRSRRHAESRQPLPQPAACRGGRDSVGTPNSRSPHRPATPPGPATHHQVGGRSWGRAAFVGSVPAPPLLLSQLTAVRRTSHASNIPTCLPHCPQAQHRIL